MKDLDELKRLLAAATPGPWYYNMRHTKDDDWLIAAAVNALPDLIAEIEALTADVNSRGESIIKCELEIERLTKERDQLGWQCAAYDEKWHAQRERITELESKLSNIASGKLNYADCLDLAHDAVNKRGS